MSARNRLTFSASAVQGTPPESGAGAETVLCSVVLLTNVTVARNDEHCSAGVGLRPTSPKTQCCSSRC